MDPPYSSCTTTPRKEKFSRGDDSIYNVIAQIAVNSASKTTLYLYRSREAEQKEISSG
jgi:hypothetical protein